MLFVGVLQCLAVLRCCELFVSGRLNIKKVLFFLFHSFLVAIGVARGGVEPFSLNIQHILSFCTLTGNLQKNTVARFKSQHLALPKNFGLATLLLVTTFVQTCISRPPRHVSQYQTFDTALSYLMFNLPLTKSSQQRMAARHSRTPMKSNITINIL